MKNSFRVGICQMGVVDDKARNLAQASKMVEDAAAQGCNLVVLPEMFTCPYLTSNFPIFAEGIPDGETCTLLKELAHRRRIYLVGGSIPELDEEHIYNTSVVFNPNGRMIARHRKIHLFDVDIRDGITFRESDTLSPGDEVTTFETGYGPMGLAICYDLRFPELSRLMVLKGARILIFPAAFNTTTGPAHWEILLRCRAVDNQVYVIAAAPSAKPGSPYPAYGHSMVVSPWGTIVTRANSEENLVIADINLEYVDRVREELPLLRHRRPEIY